MVLIKEWKPLEKMEERIRMQDICILNGFSTTYIFQMHGSEECKVKRDFIEGISRNSYYVRRILYTLNEVLSSSDHVVKNLPEKKFTGEMGYHGHLPFKFDSFISSSFSLLETPFKNRIDKYLSKQLSKELNDLFPQRDDPQSLLWRLNILRNRAVHVDDETYSENFGVFGEFSSNLGAIGYKNGEVVEMRTTLIDIESTPSLIPIIESLIQDRSKNFMDEAFGSGRPKGVPKKNQNLLYFSSGMNLLDGFPSIANQVLNLLDGYHHFIAQWFQAKIDPSNFDRKWLISGALQEEEQAMFVKEMFPNLSM